MKWNEAAVGLSEASFHRSHCDSAERTKESAASQNLNGLRFDFKVPTYSNMTPQTVRLSLRLVSECVLKFMNPDYKKQAWRIMHDASIHIFLLCVKLLKHSKQQPYTCIWAAKLL